VSVIAPEPLRVDDKTIAEFLDRLDRATAPALGAEARSERRFRYRPGKLVLDLPRADREPTARHTVVARNLSSRGAGLLSTQFVYPGSICRIVLPGPQGVEQSATGRVVRCRYLIGSRSLYELGVQFDRAVDVTLLAPDAQRVRVVLVDEDPVVRELVQTVLPSVNVDFRCHAAPDNIAALVGEQGDNCDLLLLDLESKAFDAFALIPKIRALGYLGPIVGLAVQTGRALRDRCAAAGCTGYLGKPIVREGLINLLNSIRQEPLLSELVDDEALIPLINEFVAGLRSRARDLSAAVERNDLDALHTLALRLRADAGSYGFPEITTEAEHVQSLVAIEASSDRLHAAVYDLIHLCLVAQPVRGGTDTALTARRPRRQPRTHAGLTTRPRRR
jgi:CheY-like chemotaxis protein